MKKRIFWMDLVRTVAISCVLLIHVDLRWFSLYFYELNRFTPMTFLKLLSIQQISLVGVPLFLMLSGALILKENLFTKKHWHRILRLIYALFLSYMVYQLFILKNVSEFNLQKLLTGIFFGENYYIVQWWGAWYLYVIIFLYVIAPFLYKLLINLSDKQLKLFLLLIFVFSIGLNTINIICSSTGCNFLFFPYNISWVPFSSFSLSYLFYFILFFGFLFGVCIHFLWYMGNIFYNRGLEIETLFIFFMSFALFVLAKNNAKYLDLMAAKFKKVVTFIALNSFGMFLFHFAVMLVCSFLNIPNRFNISLSVKFILLYIIVYVVSLLVTVLLKKTFLRKVLSS